MAKKNEPTDVQLEKTGTYRDALAPELSAWRSAQNAEMRRINEMNTNIYGVLDPKTGKSIGGQLGDFNDQAAEAMRRLAAAYASRGMLRSGGYGGSTRGAAVNAQKQNASQRQQIINPYISATEAERLKQFGLNPTETRPDAKVSMTKDFDWITTEAGQTARARALQEARNAWLTGKITV